MSDNNRRKSTLYAYAGLSGILAAIAEERSSSHNIPKPDSFRNQLIQWYQAHLTSMRNPSLDTLCLRVLWHEAFLALYADLDFLDRVVGREGYPVGSADITHITDWVNDVSGQHCVIHAMLIVDRIRTLGIGAEPSIHVPAALFYAGCVIYCHIQYGQPPSSERLKANMAELQCIAQSDAEGSRVDVDSLQHLDSSVLHEVIDFLRRQGHWGLSRRFASILDLVFTDWE